MFKTYQAKKERKNVCGVSHQIKKERKKERKNKNVYGEHSQVKKEGN